MAILLVVVAHVDGPHGQLEVFATAGVTAFFTLSGFLITNLLIDEHTANGRINLRRFYTRRALRLFPAVAALVVVVLVASMLTDHSLSPMAVVPVLLYCTNWTLAFGQTPNVLSHTWSLAVEEQFYLLWPLVVIFIARWVRWRSWLLVFCAIGIIYSIVSRIVHWDGSAGHMRVYMGSDGRVDALLLGCALALWMHARRDRVIPWSFGVLWMGAGAWIAVYLSGLVMDYLVTPTLVAAFTAAAIAVAARGDGSGLFAWGPLRLVGRRSYGLYLWHGATLVLVPEWLSPWCAHWVSLLIALAVAWLLTLASWRWVELPFLRLKDRSTPEPATPKQIATFTVSR